jgi:hypothetical protein
VEGVAEKKAVSRLLKRWLDTRLQSRVGIQPHRFAGWVECVRDVPGAARRYLSRPEYQGDVIAAIGLLDLDGSDIHPAGKQESTDRCEWAKQHMLSAWQGSPS